MPHPPKQNSRNAAAACLAGRSGQLASCSVAGRRLLLLVWSGLGGATWGGNAGPGTAAGGMVPWFSYTRRRPWQPAVLSKVEKNGSKRWEGVCAAAAQVRATECMQANGRVWQEPPHSQQLYAQPSCCPRQAALGAPQQNAQHALGRTMRHQVHAPAAQPPPPTRRPRSSGEGRTGALIYCLGAAATPSAFRASLKLLPAVKPGVCAWLQAGKARGRKRA